MRPIDADALKHELLTNLNFMLYDGTRMGAGDLLMRRGDVMGLIIDQPTLDYAPVRHGEWIDEIEPNAVTASGREVHVFRCSACDFTWANKTAVLHYFKHCPNCGAKTDGGTKNGEND